LKERKDGQQTKQDFKYKDFKAELLEKEKKYFREKKEKEGIYEADTDNSAGIDNIFWLCWVNIQLKLSQKIGALTGFKEPALKKKLKADDSN